MSRPVPASDLRPAAQPPSGTDPLHLRGRRAVLTGIAAEQRIEQAYLDRGCICLARRWRGRRGEIDLVFRRGDLIVFVEVKSSSSFERAIESLHAAQLSRVEITALEFLAAHPDLEGLDLRIDLAAVDGTGRFRVIPNITL
jgi:putative endonuclease